MTLTLTFQTFIWLVHIVFFLCAMCLCFHTTGCDAYSFTTGGYGIVNVRTNLGSCRIHEEGSGTNKSAEELTRMGQKNYYSHCPARGSNPGFSEFNSDPLTTELNPPPPPPPPPPRLRRVTHSLLISSNGLTSSHRVTPSIAPPTTNKEAVCPDND